METSNWVFLAGVLLLVAASFLYFKKEDQTNNAYLLTVQNIRSEMSVIKSHQESLATNLNSLALNQQNQSGFLKSIDEFNEKVQEFCEQSNSNLKNYVDGYNKNQHLNESWFKILNSACENITIQISAMTNNHQMNIKFSEPLPVSIIETPKAKGRIKK